MMFRKTIFNVQRKYWQKILVIFPKLQITLHNFAFRETIKSISPPAKNNLVKQEKYNRNEISAYDIFPKLKMTIFCVIVAKTTLIETANRIAFHETLVKLFRPTLAKPSSLEDLARGENTMEKLEVRKEVVSLHNFC